MDLNDQDARGAGTLTQAVTPPAPGESGAHPSLGRGRRWTGESEDTLKEALRQSEERYWSLLDQSLQGVVITAGDPPRILSANSAMAAILGRTTDQLLGLPASEAALLVHADDRELAYQRYRSLLHAGWRAERLAVRFRHADGSWRWVDATASPITVEGDPAVQWVCFDVTDQRQAIRDLRRSEQMYRLLAENVDDIIWTADLDLRLSYVSPSDARARGVSPRVAQAQPLEERFTEEAMRRLRVGLGQALAREMAGEPAFPLTEELELCCGDGATLPTETTLSLVRDEQDRPWGLLGVTRDISRRRAEEQRRRELEGQMQRTQQLESLGLLAGGVAHDFNNLLSSMRSNIELVRAELAPPAPALERLRDMEVAARRAADLCKQLLAYAGKGSYSSVPLDLNHLVEEMANLLRVSVPGQASLRRELTEPLPAIVADATQLRQVVLNLVTNAAEALEEQPGTIWLRTGTRRFAARELQREDRPPGLRPGHYVYLEVRDSGCGMDARTRARIFEPFFSTKFTGRGLGLAAVMGILRAARGFVEVESEPGQGTTFRVLFPASQRRACATPLPTEEPGRFRGTGQLVLVVDDDRLGREGLELVLLHHGFRVAAAAGGRQALEILRERCDEVAVVLLDLTMPELDGLQTYRKLRRICPDVPVVLCSGHGPDEVAARFSEEGAGLAGYLAKPFEPAALLAKLKAVLASQAGDRSLG
jgi:PAS domain S-box-containing protein